MDASKVAVAAILSQQQEGIERPIAYASRQMNKAEQAYSASESEMLALVWATKYFRYLFGTKFVVRTDHAALTYLKHFADSSSRLRWSLKLSELDFTVEHRAGTKIVHVDALSRHVGAVMSGGTLSEESVLREQAKEKICAKINPGYYSSKCEFFRDDVGLVYRRQPEKHQLLVPQTLVHDVIRVNHDPAYAARPGANGLVIYLRYIYGGPACGNQSKFERMTHARGEKKIASSQHRWETLKCR